MSILTKLFKRKGRKSKRTFYSGRLGPHINIQIFNNRDREQQTDGDLVMTYKARDPAMEKQVDEFMQRLRAGGL